MKLYAFYLLDNVFVKKKIEVLDGHGDSDGDSEACFDFMLGDDDAHGQGIYLV